MSKWIRIFDAFAMIATNTALVFVVINVVLLLISPPNIDKQRGYALTDYARLRYTPFNNLTRAHPEPNAANRTLVVGNERLLTKSVAHLLKGSAPALESVALPFSKGFDSTLYASRLLHRGVPVRAVVYLDSNFEGESAPYQALRDSWERSQFSETVIPLPQTLPVFRWVNALREKRIQRSLDQRALERYPKFTAQMRPERHENWETVMRLRQALHKTFDVPYLSLWARCGRLSGSDPKTHRPFDEACSNSAKLAAFINDESLSIHK